MKHVWKQIEGFCGGGIPRLYSKMVEKFPPGSRFVEVGSFLGQSTACMIVEIIKSNKDIRFDCVDVWEKLPTFTDKQLETPLFKKLPDQYFSIFEENLKQFDLLQYVNPLQQDSVEASQEYQENSLDFVFIDGDHRYEFVKRDIEAWLPKIKPGGILSGHDYNRKRNGVKQAVKECLPENIDVWDQCWLYEK